MKLMLSSRHVMHESITSKRLLMKAHRSRSLVRTSFYKEDKESRCGGGEGDIYGNGYVNGGNSDDIMVIMILMVIVNGGDVSDCSSSSSSDCDKW